MDEFGEHCSQQTDTGTENEIPHILAHRQVMKKEHMETGKGVLNTGVYWRKKGRAGGRGRWGGIAWGKMPNVGEAEKKSKAHCHVCTYATALHALLM